MLPAASAHFCHYLPPEHLRDRVVACAKRRRAACPTVGLLESAELVIRLGELSRDGGQDRLLFELAEKAAGFFSHRDCGGEIAGQELDIDPDASVDRRERRRFAPLDQLGAQVGNDRPRLIEAAEHRERPGPV